MATMCGRLSVCTCTANTLLYRLERARTVLGADLDDAETRLALQVALKIGRVIGRRGADGLSSTP